MTTQRDSFLQEVQSIRSELGRLLEGLDYSFDWKPDDEVVGAGDSLPPGGHALRRSTRGHSEGPGGEHT